MRPPRRLIGLQQARAALLARRGIEPEELPPALLDRTRQVVGSEVRTAEEAVARIIALVRAFKKIPDLIVRLDEYYPPAGAAPPSPPLPEIAVIERRAWWGYAAAGVAGAAIGAALLFVLG